MSTIGKIKVGGTTYDIAYPIGSIYLSVNDTSPAELFGGTWEQLKERFLLAAGDTYAAGSTGGEAQHTLTVDEMPSHTHFSNDGWSGIASNSSRTVRVNLMIYSKSKNKGHTNPYIDARTGVDSTLSSTGKNKPHNNMPPYLAVYMWKRTA